MSQASSATVDWLSVDDQQRCFDRFKIKQNGKVTEGLDFEQFQKFLSSSVYSYLAQMISVRQTGPVEPSSVKFKPDQEAHLFQHFDLNGDHLLDRDEFAVLCQNWLHPIYCRKSALVIVDVQNDFIDGSLALIKSPAEQDGAEVVPVINNLLNEHLFDLVVYTQDWHPSDHIGFHDNLHMRKYSRKNTCAKVDDGCNDRGKHNDVKSNPTSAIETNNVAGGGSMIASKLASRLSSNVKVFDRVFFDEGRMEQILWPRHCVQGSWGAELHPKLEVIPNSVRILKGTLSHVDAYSAFWENLRLNETNLRDELTSRGVTDVFFCGLAYDYCVAASALDSRRAGFMTYVIEDACRGINKDSIKTMTNDMVENDILIVSAMSTCDYLAATRNGVQAYRECPQAEKSNIGVGHDGQCTRAQDNCDDKVAAGSYKMRSNDIGALMIAACFKKAFLTCER